MTKLCPVKTSPRLPEISFFSWIIGSKVTTLLWWKPENVQFGTHSTVIQGFLGTCPHPVFQLSHCVQKMQLWMIHSSNFKEMWFTWWCRKACHTGWPPPWPWRTRWRWPSSILKPKDPLWNIFNLVRFCGICPYIKVSDTFCTGEGKEFLTQPLVPNVHWGKLFSNFPSSSVVQLFRKWLNS